MNASGRPNTCKSRGSTVAILVATGARVRNAYAIYLLLENSLPKGRLMLHNIMLWHHNIIKDPSVIDEHA
jgi:hypothetical protein